MPTRSADRAAFVYSPALDDASRHLTGEEMAVVEAMDASMEKEVSVTLTGTFRQGMISVEQRTISLDSSGSGSETIDVFPPSVNVQVLTASPGPCRYEFSVKINGKEQGHKGVSPAGKRVHSFAFPISDFGL